MKFNRQVIDGHYHIERWARKDGMSFLDSTGEYQNGRGIRAVNLCSLPCCIPSWLGTPLGVDINIACALYKLKHPETYVHGGLSYHEFPMTSPLPEGMDMLSQYRDMMALGLDGIKILETKTKEQKLWGLRICDALYEPFFAAAEADGTHFVWHVADPLLMWEPGQMYADGSYPSQEDTFRDVFTVLDRHPNLNVTFAHFFFMSDTPERLEEIFAKYPNVNVDVTPGAEMFGSFGKNREYYREFFVRNADRISYGTDATDWFGTYVNFEAADNVYHFLTTDRQMDFWGYQCQGLALDEDTLCKILWKNFQRRVSPAPKTVTPQALKAYLEKYRPMMCVPEMIEKLEEEISKL